VRSKTRKSINHIEYGGQMADVVILPLRLRPSPQQVIAGRVQIRVAGGRPGAPSGGAPPVNKSRHGGHPDTRALRVES
jgi:hypothetical protein